MHVKDRTFVITGGASGLGLATAEDLHQRGGYIAILDMNPENGEKVVKSIGGDRAKFFEVDVTETESLEAAVKSVVEWTKQTSRPIGGVIPAAGVGRPGKLLDRNLNPIKMEALDWVIDINLRGVLNTIRLMLPHMARNEPIGEDNERGVIVMVSSSSAFEGQVGQLSYAATKGAIRSMTLVLARDLAPNGIRAMSVAPSLFKTAMSDQLSPKVLQALVSATEYPKRLGNAKEFAMMVRQCIENPYLNGECVRLDALQVGCGFGLYGW
ncbi:3-hydroxyacyl-CoA dehydrogenase like protein [Zymoseptoria brevis]|uniref:3-hydroxyacyl-CoA dehydrogenase like protein n=1 Tax=Zymoseptoria brevis TaxID=1047168 RepID=A0A0F4GLP4_9PEZI|nr:3-hydroxyacyl-CoA dehydrogenase like protein [Zymoseptoria brevis]